jgi:hypothetical protein
MENPYSLLQPVGRQKGTKKKKYLVLAEGEFGTVPKLSIAFNSLPA